MYLSCVMITFRSSGNRIFNGRLGCVCSFPSFEEWEEQRCAGQRARVTVAAAAGKDCVKVFTRSLDHRSRLFFPVLSYGSLPPCSGRDITQTQACIYPTTSVPDFRFCLLESITTVVLFYHFIQAAGGSSGTEECLSEVNTTAHRVDTHPF